MLASRTHFFVSTSLQRVIGVLIGYKTTTNKKISHTECEELFELERYWKRPHAFLSACIEREYFDLLFFFAEEVVKLTCCPPQRKHSSDWPQLSHSTPSANSLINRNIRTQPSISKITYAAVALNKLSTINGNYVCVCACVLSFSLHHRSDNRRVKTRQINYWIYIYCKKTPRNVAYIIYIIRGARAAMFKHKHTIIVWMRVNDHKWCSWHLLGDKTPRPKFWSTSANDLIAVNKNNTAKTETFISSHRSRMSAYFCYEIIRLIQEVILFQKKNITLSLSTCTWEEVS